MPGKSYIERLGIHPYAQTFFKPYLTDTGEDLIFKYGNSCERVSAHFHQVPRTAETWSAGNQAIAHHIFICGSAMDAIAWLHFHHYLYRHENLLFVSVGTVPSNRQIDSLVPRGKQYHLLFSNDVLGAIADLKVASFLRKIPVRISTDDWHYIVSFKSKNYQLAHLSLHTLEKAARFHFNILTHKPRPFNTYFEQLQHGHRS